MSAPTTRDPLKVTTSEGAVWTRRGVNPQGRGLYAFDGVEDCPTRLLVTLAELAEHGVRSADPVAEAVAELGALPVPLGHGFASREDSYESPLHHDYAVPHDLPETEARP
ncbi:hypothetical protein [Streptomyces sp. NPDC096153]|uniref:hypothetical protein n=1 Tax=Streptomyces sp. NPDC096153 TaxID=3155548 RepID=UPI003320329A